MKRVIVSALVLLVLASVSFAAPAKTAPVVSKSSGLGAGVDVGGVPYVRINMSDTQAVDLGLGFVSTGAIGGAAANSTLNFLARYQADLMTLPNSIGTYWGGQLVFGTASAASTTTFTLSGILGAEYAINPTLSIYSNVVLLSFESISTGGASQTNFALLAGSNMAYSGIRINL